MHNYQLRAYRADGQLLFCATVRAIDDADVRRRVGEVDLSGRTWELRRGARLVVAGQPAARPAEAQSASRSRSGEIEVGMVGSGAMAERT